MGQIHHEFPDLSAWLRISFINLDICLTFISPTMCDKPKIVLHFLADSIRCGGMDTPIRLVSSKRQMAFLGEITDLRLKRMLRMNDPLVIGAVRMVLGKIFTEGASAIG